MPFGWYVMASEMSLLTRAAIPLVLACFGGHLHLATIAGPLQDGQAVKSDHPRTASVSGRVTIGGSPAVGVQLALVPGDAAAESQGTTRAKTDQDGHYLLDSLASGYYLLQVVAGGNAVQGELREGRRIALQEALKLENIDFALVPGGVITGRVTDGDGSPIAELSPTLKLVDEKGRSRMFYPGPQESRTDDRGIYRIYGLPPGRYIIGFGREWDGPTLDQNDIVLVSRQLYAISYYPGVVDEANSKTVEVTAGSEITGIDIRLTVKKRLFKAEGIVVDADTGVPIAGAEVSQGRLWDGGGEGPGGGVRCDSDGRFKFGRLQSGKHFVKLSSDYGKASNSFCDQITFEIADGDVDGLEVKVHHGSAISGVVVPASPNDENIASAMASREVYAIQLRTNPDNGTLTQDSVAQGPIAADRSFRLAGLPPGKYRLQLSNEPADSYCIQYIEVPGVGRLTNRAPYPPGSFDGDPIAIGEGRNNQDIRGVRIALGTARGIIRGQIKFEGGPLPPNALTNVSVVMLPASDTRQYSGAAVDADGRFVIKSLAAGQYVIRAAAYIYHDNTQKDGGMKVLARASETVTIANGQEATVTLTLNLSGGQ
jgi:hypothetical protein